MKQFDDEVLLHLLVYQRRMHIHLCILFHPQKGISLSDPRGQPFLIHCKHFGWFINSQNENNVTNEQLACIIHILVSTVQTVTLIKHFGLY